MGQFGTESGEMDTLVLGCTHYPFAAETLHNLVGEQVVFLEGGAPVARQTRRLLAERGWLAQPDATPTQDTPSPIFASTGNPETLRSAIERWLQLTVTVQTLTIA